MNSIPLASWCCSVLLFSFFNFLIFDYIQPPYFSSHQMYDGPRQRFPKAIRPQRWIVNMKGNVTYYLSTVQRFRTNLLRKEKYHHFSHHMLWKLDPRFLTQDGSEDEPYLDILEPLLKRYPCIHKPTMDVTYNPAFFRWLHEQVKHLRFAFGGGQFVGAHK